MTPDEFEASLQADGFGEITTVDRAADYQLGEHAHPFEACALILRGEITLVVEGAARTYRVDEVFRLAADTPHLESAGPQGVAYLVGRKRQAAP